jgi:pSer/pThr/pTyr-binding forkhead associated (FHA) protein
MSKMPSEGPIEGTRVESVDEIRQIVRSKKPVATARESAADTQPYRPLRRPPLALLCILDDGGEEGEWARLRGERVIIGRTEGDILIPHDSMISARHAELYRQEGQGRHRWYIADLQSTNGVFLRVGNAALKHNHELLIGSRMYRFEMPLQGTPPGEEAKGTRGWQGLAPAQLFPSLVEVEQKNEIRRYVLEKPENWIGRDENSCSVAVPEDPFVSPRHARIYRDAKNRWLLENAKSLNGTWLRVERFPLDGGCQFQLGEQRFLFRIL